MCKACHTLWRSTRAPGLALALANAFAFRRIWSHRLAKWDRNLPLSGRLQALLLCPVTGTFGRMLAYR